MNRSLLHSLLTSIIAATMWFTVSAMVAQDLPTVAVRQRLVDSLNAAINRGDTIITLHSSIALLSEFGICDTLDSIVFLVSYDSTHITLCRLTRARDTIAVSGSHRIVNDLNAWMNRMWAMELQDLPEEDTLVWLCDTNQRYYNDTTSHEPLIDRIKVLSGEDDILSTMYHFGTDSLLGSEFLTFEKSSPRTIRYMSDVVDSVRKLASFYVKLNCPDGDSLSVEFNIMFEATGASCGLLSDQTKFTITINDTLGGPGCTYVGFPSNEYLWNWYPNDSTYWFDSTGSYDIERPLGGFYVGSDGYLWFARYHDETYCSEIQRRLCFIVDTISPPEYCKMTFRLGGEFILDSITGQVVYDPPDSCCANTAELFPCLQFCNDVASPDSVQLVIAAGATTYDHVSHFSANEEVNPGIVLDFPYDYGAKGHWRPRKSFVYRTDIIPGTALFSDNPSYTVERNYRDAGVFEMIEFDWVREDENDSVKWLRTSSLTEYSQHGETVEEWDALSIPSTARYWFVNNGPFLVAKNAHTEAVNFEAFEGYSWMSTETAHTGSRSNQVLSSTGSDIGTVVTIDDQLVNEGMLIKMWIKRSYPSTSYVGGLSPVHVFLEPDGFSTVSYTQVDSVAKTGEWALYQLKITDLDPAWIGARCVIRFSNNLLPEDVWVDDLRVQPLNSEMVCYVYEWPRLRLEAMMDDQHFATLYQYNGEGKLVRKLRETQRGIKLVEEKQYHTPQTDRVPQLAYGDEGGDQGAQTGTMLGDRGGSGNDAPSVHGGTFEMLSFELGPDGEKVRVFGLPADELLRRIEQLSPERFTSLLAIPGIDSSAVYDVEKFRGLLSLKSYSDQIAVLSQRLETASTDAERQGVSAAITEAQAKRLVIAQRLGIAEADIAAAVAAVGVLQKDIEDVDDDE